MTPIWKCIFISLTFFKLSSAIDHVPVLIWSTNSSLWNRNTAEHEGHIMSKQELNRLLQPIYTQASENLVLFLQDKLSTDDFTRYSRAHGDEHPFQSVQASMPMPYGIFFQFFFLVHTADYNFVKVQLQTFDQLCSKCKMSAVLFKLFTKL
ncbi:V-type proton ATPase subunit S1-like [Protopterus annectens]|uniref:V-type proton ATPase subunit S1-like n=1 Tax=Protopterus annectens TaxID=7888 RepID=UPI001CFA7427|nr:V-type proton ATPase subunit S1-like [Protopterus annectens]